MDKTSQNSQIEESVLTVPFEKVPGTSKILVGGLEFQYATSNHQYLYWYCKYRRTLPKTCSAVCRQAIGTQNINHVELIKPHTESTDEKKCCPYVAQITDKDMIREQYQTLTKDQNLIQEALKILEENPGSSLLELKTIASKKNLDFTLFSQKQLNTIMKTYKKLNKDGINAILEASKTSNGNVFLRESCHYNLNVNGEEKTYFFNIWASPSQLSRLRASSHWYIDGTYRICPTSYYQLLIIMCRDPITNTATPCSFILTNSKESYSYERIFQSLKNIISCHEKNKIMVTSATVDFESGLHKGFRKIFPDVDLIGCLFHYKQALNRSAGKMGLKRLKYKSRTQKILRQLGSLCWKADPRAYFQKIKRRFQIALFQRFFKYIEKQWMPFILSGMLNYSNIDQQFRANSVLEAYNGRIKKFLPYRPNMRKFIDFIQNEEKYYNDEISRKVNNNEFSYPSHNFGKPYRDEIKEPERKYYKIKGLNLKKENNHSDRKNEEMSEQKKHLNPKENKSKLARKASEFTEKSQPELELKKRKISSNSEEVKQDMLENIEVRNVIKWNLQHSRNSCRYSSFFTLYKFQLLHLHPAFAIKSDNPEHFFLNKIIDTSTILPKNPAQAFQKFSEFNKKNQFEADPYGEFGSITTLFRAFRCLDFCCLRINDNKVCSSCTLKETKQNCQIGPLFGLDFKSLNSLGIQNSITSYFQPSRWTCPACHQTSSIPSQREIISFPSLLIIVLDLTFKSLEKFASYQRSLNLNGREFVLVSAVTKPSENHFALLIKNPKKDRRSKAMSGWYRYDDLEEDGDIVPIEGAIENLLQLDHGYVLIYKVVEVKQGDVGDKFYFIEDGTAEATKLLKGKDQPEIVYSYKEGDYFGELALLKDEPRAANVVATSDITLLALDRDAFTRVLGPLQDILKRNTAKYEKYM